jgi:hypothetical protein
LRSRILLRWAPRPDRPMSAADCGAPRTSLPRIARQQERSLAVSRLNRGTSAAASPLRGVRRWSRRPAKPRSRDRTQREHCARRPSKDARPIRSHARCAADQCSSVGAVTARPVCPRLGASTVSARSPRHATCSQRRLLRVRSAAQCSRESSARRGGQRRTTAAIAAGRASIRNSATRPA